MELDLDQLRSWVGRSEQRRGWLDPAPAQALAATLDRHDTLDDGDALPAPYHWLYFQPAVPQSQLGEDGHPARGGFLPPVPLPRRMWAGGALQFAAAVHVGERVRKTSEITDVQHKRGRSGDLVFVTVRHCLFNAGNELALEERQDIVYRGEPAPLAAAVPPTPAGPAAPVPTAPWLRELTPDPVLLFRYSALTFNGHRIHYDAPYAQAVEGYAGLVVHGPLLATLLLDLLRRHDARPLRAFEFRAERPALAGEPLRLCGMPGEAVQLWAENGQGQVCMRARAELG